MFYLPYKDDCEIIFRRNKCFFIACTPLLRSSYKRVKKYKINDYVEIHRRENGILQEKVQRVNQKNERDQELQELAHRMKRG